MAQGHVHFELSWMSLPVALLYLLTTKTFFFTILMRSHALSFFFFFHLVVNFYNNESRIGIQPCFYVDTHLGPLIPLTNLPEALNRIKQHDNV